MADEEAGNQGPAVDSRGEPVIDPTKNVLDLVEAAVLRQDDLRAMESRHVREILELRGSFYEALREAEAKRIDAIRSVDAAAVQRAAEVQADQALALAKQVTESAETLRKQVETTVTSQDTKLSLAVDPMKNQLADLTRAMYEAQGQKQQVVETQAKGVGVGLWVGIGIAAFVGFMGIGASMITLIIALTK